MAPIFRPTAIATFAECMTDVARRCASSLEDGDTVGVAPLATRIAMNVVGKALFGSNTFEESSELSNALSVALSWSDELMASWPVAVQLVLRERLEALAKRRNGWARGAAQRALEFLEVPVQYRFSLPGRGIKAAIDTIDRSVVSMVDERRSATERKHDLLAQLLNARDDADGAMTDQQVRDQAVNLFIGGHETTATGLAWAFHELSKDPATYARVREEADAFAARGSLASEAAHLTTCGRVFKEALRMYPPVYAYGRQPLEDVAIGNYDVPAGTIVLVSAYGLHRNPAVYPDPGRFAPERFTPEAESQRHRSAWIPFGSGPRICIGGHFAMLEGQLVIAGLSHRVTFEAKKDVEVRPAPAATLRPQGDMPMVVRLRREARQSKQPARSVGGDMGLASPNRQRG